jgi:hypothetical protein
MIIVSTLLIIDILRLCDCPVTPKLGPKEACMSLSSLGTALVQGLLYKKALSLGCKSLLLPGTLAIL